MLEVPLMHPVLLGDQIREEGTMMDINIVVWQMAIINYVLEAANTIINIIIYNC